MPQSVVPPLGGAGMRAGGYAARRQDMRMAKAAAMAGGGPLSKAQERAIKAKMRLEEGRRMDTVASAARQGVRENPVKGELNKDLERRRQEANERGTSIARVRRYGNEEEAAEEGADTETRTQDTQKLELARLPSEIKNPKLMKRRFRTGI